MSSSKPQRDALSIAGLGTETKIEIDAVPAVPFNVSLSTSRCMSLIHQVVQLLGCRCPRLFTSDSTSAPTCTPSLLSLYFVHALMWRLRQTGGLTGVAASSVTPFDEKWPLPYPIALLLAHVGSYKEASSVGGKDAAVRGNLTFSIATLPAITDKCLIGGSAKPALTLLTPDASCNNFGYYINDLVSGVPRRQVRKIDAAAFTLSTYDAPSVAQCLAECMEKYVTFGALPLQAVDGSLFATPVVSSSSDIVYLHVASPFQHFDADVALALVDPKTNADPIMASSYKPIFIPVAETPFQLGGVLTTKDCEGPLALCCMCIDSYDPKRPYHSQLVYGGLSFKSGLAGTWRYSVSAFRVELAESWAAIRGQENSASIPAADPDQDGTYFIAFADSIWQSLMASAQRFMLFSNNVVGPLYQKVITDPGLASDELPANLSNTFRTLGPIIDGGFYLSCPVPPFVTSADIDPVDSTTSLPHHMGTSVGDYTVVAGRSSFMKRATYATNLTTGATPNTPIFGIGGASATWASILAAYETPSANCVLATYNPVHKGVCDEVVRQFLRSQVGDGREIFVVHGHSNSLGEDASAGLIVPKAEDINKRVSSTIRFSAATAGLQVSRQLRVIAVAMFSGGSSTKVAEIAAHGWRNCTMADPTYSRAPYRLLCGDKDFITPKVGSILGVGSNDLRDVLKKSRDKYVVQRTIGGVTFSAENNGCWVRDGVRDFVFKPLGTIFRVGARIAGTAVCGPSCGDIAARGATKIVKVVEKAVFPGPKTAQDADAGVQRKQLIADSKAKKPVSPQKKKKKGKKGNGKRVTMNVRKQNASRVARKKVRNN